jgi:CubicO group peptidase (beta-lactamase class C family)
MTLDTVFRLASMTKAVTSVAAMQLVEQGKLQLEQPIGNVLPELAAPQVLEGFDDAGAPRLRPAKRPITLRHLLTHTAGFGYEQWDADLVRYVKGSGVPSTATAKLASLRLPLVFDPGERWEYGINIDWAGRAVEAVSGVVYFREHIFAPLGNGYCLRTGSAQQVRLVGAQRKPNGSPMTKRPARAAAAAHSTGATIWRFADAAATVASTLQLLRPETALMGQNQMAMFVRHHEDDEHATLETSTSRHPADGGWVMKSWQPHSRAPAV